MLWGQHVVWTRMVMLGILYDLPELNFPLKDFFVLQVILPMHYLLSMEKRQQGLLKTYLVITLL